MTAMANSEPFTNMAARVEACPEREFGGALVLVAPDGKKVEFLLTDPSAGQNVVAFWGFVRSRIEDAFQEIASQPAMGGFGPQRLPR